MSEAKASGIGKRRIAALNEANDEYISKRTELIRVAAQIFQQKGVAATTLNDIALAFGVDRASLYYYVSSKEELFQESIRDLTLANLENAKKIAASETSPRKRLEMLVKMFIDSQVEHYPNMYVYIGEDMVRVGSRDSKWANEMVDFTRQIEQIFLDAIHEGKAQGQVREDLSTSLIANSIFGMTQWTHRWYDPTSSRFSADDLIRVFCSLLFEGIEVREEPAAPRD